MPRLNYLNVAWNQLQNIHDEISVLQKHAASLTTLDLRHNPWQKVCRFPSLLSSVCSPLVTFRVSRRRCEMYCGHACLCVCLSAAACLHYCTDPDVTWGNGRGCPLVVQYLADLQSVNGLRCYGNTRNAWQSLAVIRRAHRTPHALRMPAKTPLASDKINTPAACTTLSATRPFYFVVHTAGV